MNNKKYKIKKRNDNRKIQKHRKAEYRIVYAL
jgi:mRNA-degrading endonuclease RelE of RelBE toxin-antitoxin system